MIKIELDEATKREVVEQAKMQLLKNVMAQFNTAQAIAEIKNTVISQAVQKISADYSKTYKTNEVVEKAVKSAESRVQSQVTKLLEKGITISFKNE